MSSQTHTITGNFHIGEAMRFFWLLKILSIIADFFLSVGLGLGGTATPQIRFRKSISNERTFSATKDKAFLYQKLGK